MLYTKSCLALANLTRRRLKPGLEGRGRNPRVALERHGRGRREQHVEPRELHLVVAPHLQLVLEVTQLIPLLHFNNIKWSLHVSLRVDVLPSERRARSVVLRRCCRSLSRSLLLLLLRRSPH